MNMLTIYKYGPLSEMQAILMPQGARILTAQIQHEAIMMWAIVDASAPKEEVVVRVIGTGWAEPEEVFTGYVATVQQGGLVWHVFATPTRGPRP